MIFLQAPPWRCTRRQDHDAATLQPSFFGASVFRRIYSAKISDQTDRIRSRRSKPVVDLPVSWEKLLRSRTSIFPVPSDPRTLTAQVVNMAYMGRRGAVHCTNYTALTARDSYKWQTRTIRHDWPSAPRLSTYVGRIIDMCGRGTWMCSYLEEFSWSQWRFFSE